MAKKHGGVKGGRNDGRRNNYFQQEIQKAGNKNFLDTKNARNFEFDSTRIFRDLARGNIDVLYYAEYFKDPNLLEALILNSNKLAVKNNIEYSGVIALINYNKYNRIFFDEGLFAAVADEHKQAMEAYTIICNHMMQFKQTHDPNVLLPMVQHLQRYRYKI